MLPSIELCSEVLLQEFLVARCRVPHSVAFLDQLRQRTKHPILVGELEQRRRNPLLGRVYHGPMLNTFERSVAHCLQVGRWRNKGQRYIYSKQNESHMLPSYAADWNLERTTK